MCGIAGIANKSAAAGSLQITEALLKEMAQEVCHRGPDDEGYFLRAVSGRGPQVGFGHRRLSIIDLKSGQQPISNEDGTVHIIYNGEIYNFPELRRDLKSRGHVFKTHTDTEVIVHLYEEKGPDCVLDLRGMFAFAIWDEKRKRLFLARDRLGQKPLCYYHRNGIFAFGSEIKSILSVPGVERAVNLEAIHHYLTYQYVPHPLTMFYDIHKLSPAHYLIYEDDTVSVTRYWEPDFSTDHGLSEEEYCEQLRELLKECTRMRLISDVPLGAFLSGGIDSSIIVGLMSQLTDEPVKTFAIGFKEKKFDELNYARMAAKAFQTDHREFIVEPNAIEVLPELIWHYNEPFADSSAIPTYYVSKMTSQHVKVALTGDAGDECFAGYPRYKAAAIAGVADKTPRLTAMVANSPLVRNMPVSAEAKSIRRRGKKLLQALALPPEERYLKWICIFDDERKNALYTDDFRALLADPPQSNSARFLGKYYDRCGGNDFIGRTTFVDMMTYLPDDLMVKVDIASMAHSLETRSPFLDHKFVEFVAGIPTDLKLHGLKDKYILKKAFADILPPEILNRRKMGFGVPIGRWFREELSQYISDILLSERSVSRGYFRADALNRLVWEHTSAKFDHGYRLWSLLNLELWHRRFIDQDNT